MPSIVPGIPLMLDKERHLRLDIGGLLLAEREMERLWGREINLFTVIASPTGLGLNNVSILLWVALLPEDPALTLLRVQDLLNPSQIGDVVTALFAAWNAAWPLPVPDAEPPARPLASASTGDDSGAPPASTLASVMPSSGA